jgi:hypothetical protein
MLVLTSKKYEVEETIKAVNEENETLYEFQMQITPNEMKELRDILFDEKSMNLAKKSSKEKDEDKKEIIDNEIIKRAYEIQEKFENICFKEHKETFKEKCGEYKYLEMVDMMYDFFMKAFIDKRAKQVNTISTNLKRIGNN